MVQGGGFTCGGLRGTQQGGGLRLRFTSIRPAQSQLGHVSVPVVGLWVFFFVEEG